MKPNFKAFMTLKSRSSKILCNIISTANALLLLKNSRLKQHFILCSLWYTRTSGSSLRNIYIRVFSIMANSSALSCGIKHRTSIFTFIINQYLHLLSLSCHACCDWLVCGPYSTLGPNKRFLKPFQLA